MEPDSISIDEALMKHLTALKAKDSNLERLAVDPDIYKVLKPTGRMANGHDLIFGVEVFPQVGGWWPGAEE